MRRSLLILIAVFSIALFTKPVQACQCMQYETPVCAVFWEADAVFVGQVAEIKPLENSADRNWSYVEVHFIVDQPFRGVSGPEVVVGTSSGTMCDVKFQKGSRYLVYASLDDQGKQLFTGFCSHTKPLKYAEDDLTYIRSVIQQSTGESISGKVVRNRYENLAGLKVRVEGNDKTFETTTDQDGNFSVSLPASGSFKVRVFVPFAAEVLRYGEEVPVKATPTDTLTTVDYEVKLEKNQCDYQQLDTFKFDPHATAIVTGQVLTPSGQAVTNGSIYFVDAKNSSNSHSTRLTEDGAFKFEGIAAGEYYLVINPHNEAPNTYDAPYPRTYFPSAADAGEATKIVVTEGASLENLTLRVGPPLKQRRISGTVLWKDNRGLKDPHVSVYTVGRYLQSVDVDKQGKFDFVVHGDFGYSIEASEDQTGAKSELVTISPTRSTGIKLVLRPRNE